MREIKEISKILSKMNEKEIYFLFQELLTCSEIETLSKRWRILKMLNDGVTQRQIADELGVGLCKVTRGAKILKKTNSIVNKIMKKGGFNDRRKIN